MLKLKKYAFFQDCIEYIGHRTKSGKLEIDRRNKESLRQTTQLTTKSEHCSFLVLCNVYRHFIANFTKINYPLNQLLKNGKHDTFTLNEKLVQNFGELIDQILFPQVLALP